MVYGGGTPIKISNGNDKIIKIEKIHQNFVKRTKMIKKNFYPPPPTVNMALTPPP